MLGGPAGALQPLPKAVPAAARLLRTTPGHHRWVIAPCGSQAGPLCPRCLRRGREVRSQRAQRGPGESPRGMQPVMREERSSQPPLLKRRAAEEEEAGRKEGLVCLFPEWCRNCYMRNYLTSLTSPDALHRLHPPFPCSSLPPAPATLPRVVLLLLLPLSYPGTSSWFPPGCKSSSASLRSKFIRTCSSSPDGPHSLPVCGFMALPSRESRGGWFVGFQLQGGCHRCGVACGMLCGTQLGNRRLGKKQIRALHLSLTRVGLSQHIQTPHISVCSL